MGEGVGVGTTGVSRTFLIVSFPSTAEEGFCWGKIAGCGRKCGEIAVRVRGGALEKVPPAPGCGAVSGTELAAHRAFGTPGTR